MLDVAVEVVGRIADASIGNETLAVVEADEAVPADHLADHIIRQVPLVGTDGARVGVGRNERRRRSQRGRRSRCRLNGRHQRGSRGLPFHGLPARPKSVIP